MIVYVTKYPDGLILLRARAEGDGIIGDLSREVRPGESAMGKTYEEWAAAESPVAIDD